MAVRLVLLLLVGCASVRVAMGTVARTATEARLAFSVADARVAYGAAADLVKDCTPRAAGTPEGRRAAEWICARVGAPARLDRFRALSRGEMRDFANVVAEFPGTDPAAPWIVLMSHFDTAPTVAGRFEGANDGASTSGLLVAFAGALRRTARLRYSVLLCWTDAEECRVVYGPDDGFRGSRRLLRTLRAQNRVVRAAICLDMLGDRDLHVTAPCNSDAVLKALASRAAASARCPFSVDEEIVIHDDHSAFFDAGVPALDLIDFSFGSAPGLNNYWHTPQDTLDKISSASLHAAGRLVAELLNQLSEGKCNES